MKKIYQEIAKRTRIRYNEVWYEGDHRLVRSGFLFGVLFGSVVLDILFIIIAALIQNYLL